MTAIPTRPVVQPAAAIFDLLAAGRPFDQVCQLGGYRRAWSPSDVQAVVCGWFPGRCLKPRPSRRRRPPAVPGMWFPPSVDVEETVTVTPDGAVVLTELCLGADLPELAERLHLAAGSARNAATRVVSALGVRDRAQAVAGALNGRLAVQVTAQPSRHGEPS